MSDPLFRFRSLCSMIREQSLREHFEIWAIQHVKEFRVEARVDKGSPEGATMHFQKQTLINLAQGVIKEADEIEHREWMQGDHDFGTIITRRVRLLVGDK